MAKSLDDFLRECAKDVDGELGSFFPKKPDAKWLSYALGKPDFEFDLPSTNGAIAAPVWDFLSRGGKRWRPALMLLACEAVGGSRKKAMPFTVIPELVHSGTLLIDDIEDNSSLRRGKPATHLLFGVDVAINAGNAMYYLPLVLLFRSNSLPDKVKGRIYDLYALEMLRLSFGQAMDIYWHRGHGNVSQKHYLQMCSFKTGSLARFAAELGAVLGGASKPQIDALGDFATSIGVAFQIQDDILNIKPASVEWGKEIGDDIKEGKRTLMVIHALKVLPDAKAKKLVSLLDLKEKSDAQVKDAIGLLESCGAIDYSRKVARDLVSSSWKRRDKKLRPSQAKSMLKEFAAYLIERKI